MRSFTSQTKLTLLAAAALGFLFAPAPAKAFDNSQTKEIEKIIASYLLENPTIIQKALDKYNVGLAEAADQMRLDAIKKNKKHLTGKNLPSIGNPNASVTVVEFFDYNCGYCKRALTDVIQTVANDKDVRIVFHELPILSEDSKLTAEWALAAHKQGKYYEFHKAMMKYRGAKNINVLTKISNDIGLDAEKMRKDAKSDAIAKELQTSIRVAREIGVSGTPAFIVNDEFYGGYLGKGGLERVISQAREK